MCDFVANAARCGLATIGRKQTRVDVDANNKTQVIWTPPFPYLPFLYSVLNPECSVDTFISVYLQCRDTGLMSMTTDKLVRQLSCGGTI